MEFSKTTIGGIVVATAVAAYGLYRRRSEPQADAV
jgi:hypothetical protein